MNTDPEASTNNESAADKIVAVLNHDIETSRSRSFEKSCRFVMGLGLMIFILSLLTGLYFTFSPLIRGQGFAEFFNFLIVPLGLTALVATPGAILFFTARHILREGPGTGPAMIMTIIALPWLFYAGLGVSKGFALWQIMVMTFIGALTLGWAVTIYRARQGA